MSELKPWMVEYIRDPHPDYLPEDMGKTQLQASHAIAAAIEAELERTPEREAVTDEEAKTFDGALRYQKSVGNPYATHVAIEGFLRDRRRAILGECEDTQRG